ncbi:helix-turn-helix domain-containing protein [Brevibacillus agri]|uniref:helix-turn-helix domain-containing protein n=1 Tax=Brevibacillus agri TaxID=51101 RepID=UPI001C8E4BAD|nr:helix-turn-helix domain-containing protein [Brevibacillus agri]MBY0054099.1 helix-turn-helix domain-containing protein [Brevibacillus agri]
MGVSDKIVRLMKKKGLSRYKLAKESGVPYTTLIKILDGTTKNPQIETLSAIADVLKVPVDYLLGRGDIYDIGWAIREEREEQGLTADELGDAIGVHEEIILDYESDQMPISLAMAEKITNAFGLSYVAFLDKYNLYDEYLPPQFEDDADQYEAFKAAVDRDAQSDAYSYTLTPKEEHDIVKDLERIMADLESNQALAFHGEPIDDEEMELLRASLENSLRIAKMVAKKKFTPKKYRK